MDPNMSNKWEQMLRLEEASLLEEFLDTNSESAVEQIQPPRSQLPVMLERVLQLEEPPMSRKDLLRALGVFLMEPK